MGDEDLLYLLQQCDIDSDIDFDDILSAYDIKLSICNIRTDLSGFVYYSCKGLYHIIINANLDFTTQRKVFLHEIVHIIRDMPKISYYIGLDMQHFTFEVYADKLAKKLLDKWEV